MKKDEEKFVWYEHKSIWMVIILGALAFLNLYLGNPLGR